MLYPTELWEHNNSILPQIVREAKSALQNYEITLCLNNISMAEAAEGQQPIPQEAPKPEPLHIPEDERKENGKVAFVGATVFPKWEDQITSPRQPDHEKEIPDITRGDQVLANVKNLLEWGYNVVIIDGGSSDAFQNALKALANEDPQLAGHLLVQEQNKEQAQRTTLGEAQRIGYRVARDLPGVEALMVTQPEKPFTYEDLRRFTAPILSGKADMVIPYRVSELKDYPPEQRRYELWGNREMSEALQNFGLLPDGVILDIYNGTRIVRNDPHILDAILMRFDETVLSFYRKLSLENPALLAFLDPDQWFAVLYGPVARLLFEGYRIASVDSDYKHPPAQTAQETGNPVFDRKRAQQWAAIVPYFADFLMYLWEQSQKKKSTL